MYVYHERLLRQSSQKNAAALLSPLVSTLLKHRLQHALPVCLEARECLRGGHWGFDDAEFKRALDEDLGVLSPGEETGSDGCVEWAEVDDVDL